MKTSFLLLLQRNKFDLYRDDELVDSQPFGDSEVPAEEPPELIAQALLEAGFRNEHLSLAIGSGQVFCLPIQLDSKIISQPNALRFAIEEHLPIDAEQIATTIVRSAGGQLAVVVDREPIEKLIEQLGSDHGILVRNAIPSTPRLIEHLIETTAIENTCRLIVFDDPYVELVEVRDGQLSFWKRSYSTQFFQMNPRRFFDQSDNCPSYLIGCANESVDAINSNGKTETLPILIAGNYRDLVAASFDSLHNRGRDTSFDLAGQMGTTWNLADSVAKSWEVFAFSLIVLILCLAGGLGYQAYRHHQGAGQVDLQIRQDYRNLFPGTRINGPIEKLLINELAKQRSENKLVGYANRSALLLANLQKLLVALPDGYRFERIKILADGIVLDGEVETLSQLDNLRRKLESAGFEIQPGSYTTRFSLTLLVNKSFKKSSSKGQP